MGDGFGATFQLEFDAVAIETEHRAPGPVFDFENEQAPAWAEDDEIGLASFGADGHVVPDHVVVRQAALELVQHGAFAGVIAALVDIAEALRKNGHGLLHPCVRRYGR